MTSTKAATLLVTALLGGGFLACSGTEPSPQHTQPAASSGGEPTASTRKSFDRAHHMQATLWMALSARDALIDGNLGEAKTAARALAQHDYEASVPATWKPWIGELQKHAGDLVIAKGIDDAAQSLSAIGLACGSCHYHHEAGLTVRREPPMAWEDSSDTIGERMDRHAQGIEQMWTGLVQPSEEAWRSGTVTLTRAPLEAPTTEGGTVGPRAAAEIERVRGLARRARTASSHAERAQIYGQLIAGCGHCHTTTPRSL
jgi:cytochrome c553